MSPYLKTAIGFVAGFIADHLHLRFLASQQEPPVQKTPRTRDMKRLTDGQIILLIKTWDQFKHHNANRAQGQPRLTQGDLMKWANDKFGCNKSRKTYMRIINEYKGKNL